MNQDFGAPEANLKWESDITHLWTREGWLYLVAVLELFLRRVVGWIMQQRQERSLVVHALTSALCQRRADAGLLHHSDRGSQYASGDFQALLKERGIACSRSRTGNCYDNAVVERFFGTLKQEWVNLVVPPLRREFCATRERRTVFSHRDVLIPSG